MVQRIFDSAQEPEVICRYEAGESLRQLAVAFNCAPATIQGVLERRLVARRRAGGTPRLFTHEDERELARRYTEDGDSLEALAIAHGCSIAAIRRALAQRGVQPRSFSEAQIRRNRLRDEHHSLTPRLI